ncbi:methyltransferase [Burkholderia sp. ABCPW 11]|uniref:methyltransferase n=1 Tax=Burkholderia sp. ABCPW 11 TaxID=1637859 RepID=UPI00075B1765|nr:methyltransferase [Burkholderia sp. ABCPW 11]KVD39700.1 methyltransferase [Burkholderia sp. ABCPW 11]
MIHHAWSRNDTAAYDVAFGLFIYPAMLIAHRLGLFRRLGEGPCTLLEISSTLGLARRPTEALANAAVALGFVHRDGKEYRLTTLGECLLLEGSPTYFGAFWDLMYDNAKTYSLEGLEEALRRNEPKAYGEPDIFRTHEEQHELGMRFTRAMQSSSVMHALAWPTRLDLGQHRVMLDIGGGSGAHLTGALSTWPELRGTLFDLPAVCKLARGFIDAALSDRITLHPGDMWRDPYPPADLHFYSNIFHDWTPEKNAILACKSFEALPVGGRIILHEVLYRDDKSGPLAAAGFSLMMMGWTEGEQYTSAELTSVLKTAGFASVNVVPSLGYYSLVTGVKE